MYKVASGECVEASVNAPFSFYFADFKKGTCEEQGFTAPPQTTTVAEPYLGKVVVSIYKPEQKAEKTFEFHKVKNDKCTQWSFKKKDFDPALVLFSGLREGRCASQGFPEFDGIESLRVSTVSFYRKPGFVKDNTMTVFKITEDTCAQAAIYQPLSFFLSEFRKGTCADQGFSSAAGSEVVDEPFLGEIAVNFF
eukprot:gnl/TRDRNA2_/TRDRNA2_168380_c0_seq1.p1 gnl/TRDRNA2_/TRDRNA2_168380_c0~~gnl/TRDRNA2_/TRDRNA2_168380_c0_seq1.p1  ORF type:complete len:194 (+),score=38.07 gnl/TRDRNA2_/TRDRNA2_168380_c0_seq1:380-961(+)